MSSPKIIHAHKMGWAHQGVVQLPNHQQAHKFTRGALIALVGWDNTSGWHISLMNEIRLPDLVEVVQARQALVPPEHAMVIALVADNPNMQMNMVHLHEIKLVAPHGK